MHNLFIEKLSMIQLTKTIYLKQVKFSLIFSMISNHNIASDEKSKQKTNNYPDNFTCCRKEFNN